MNIEDKFKELFHDKPSTDGVDADALWENIEKELDADVSGGNTSTFGWFKLLSITAVVLTSVVAIYFYTNTNSNGENASVSNGQELISKNIEAKETLINNVEPITKINNEGSEQLVSSGNKNIGKDFDNEQAEKLANSDSQINSNTGKLNNDRTLINSEKQPTNQSSIADIDSEKNSNETFVKQGSETKTKIDGVQTTTRSINNDSQDIEELTTQETATVNSSILGGVEFEDLGTRNSGLLNVKSKNEIIQFNSGIENEVEPNNKAVVKDGSESKTKIDGVQTTTRSINNDSQGLEELTKQEMATVNSSLQRNVKSDGLKLNIEPEETLNQPLNAVKMDSKPTLLVGEETSREQKNTDTSIKKEFENNADNNSGVEEIRNDVSNERNAISDVEVNTEKQTRTTFNTKNELLGNRAGKIALDKNNKAIKPLKIKEATLKPLKRKINYKQPKAKKFKIPKQFRKKAKLQIALLTGFNYSLPNYKSNTADDKGFTQLVNNSISGKMGNSVSVKANWLFKNIPLTVGSGIEFTQLIHRFSTIQNQDSTYVNVNEIQVNGVARRNVINANKYNYLSIPIQIGVHSKINKFKISITAGSALNVLVKQHGKAYNNSNEIIAFDGKTKNTQDFNTLFYSIFVNPAINYRISKGKYFQFSPSVNYMQNGKSNLNGLKQQNLLFDFKLGFAFEF